MNFSSGEQPHHSTSVLETFRPNHDEKTEYSFDSGLVFSQKDVETNMDAVLDKTTEEDPYDEVGADLAMQETPAAATENEEEGRANAEVAVNQPQTAGKQERENVYDEIVSVARIPEASSMEELGKSVYYGQAKRC